MNTWLHTDHKLTYVDRWHELLLVVNHPQIFRQALSDSKKRKGQSCFTDSSVPRETVRSQQSDIIRKLDTDDFLLPIALENTTVADDVDEEKLE